MPEEVKEVEQEQDQEQAEPVEAAETAEAESGDDDEQKREESAASEEGEQEESEQAKAKKGGFQRKIDKLTARWKAAEAERDHLRQKLLGEAKPEAKPEAVTARPRPEDFRLKDADGHPTDQYDAAKYEEAVAKWTDAELDRRLEERERKRQEEAEKKRLNQAYEERERKAAEKHKDWVEVVGEAGEATVMGEMYAIAGANPDARPSLGVVQQALLHADPEGDLEYYLASNLEEVRRIAKLPPIQAALEIGKLLGTKLAPRESTADPAGKARPAVSNAPPPPKTLSKSSPTASGLSDDLSDEDWLKKREEQIRQQRKKR